MSRRDQIRMTSDEINDYLADNTVLNVATMGPNGRPHLAPLWYFPTDGEVLSWTFGKSQKVANLRRLGEATALIESGDSYDQLRGITMECDVRILDDVSAVTDIGLKLMRRYSGDDADTPNSGTESEASASEAAANAVAAQAAKRVGLVFTPTKIVSWDHRKLGGAY